jgi:replicative DNA helicase
MEGTTVRDPTTVLAWRATSTESEDALLGALLINEDAQGYCLPRLTEDCFTRDHARVLFRTVRTFYDQGKRIDPVLVRTGTGKGIDPLFITDVMGSCPVPSNYRFYLRCVLENHDARELASASSTAAMQAAAGDPDAARRSWDEVMPRLLADDEGDEGIYPAERLVDTGLTVAESYMQGDRAVLGIPTGFPSLDRFVSGLVPGNVIVVAGRPGQGKSLFGSNMLVNVAKQGHRAVLFSIEMTAQEVAMRILCREAQVNWQSLRDGKVEDAHALIDATERLREHPFTVVDDARLGLGSLQAYSRAFHPEVVIVDYVQLMATGQRDNRQEEVAAVSRGLKMLAKERGVCVVALAQLNRDIDKRGDGASPQLSDLRDSGSLEQDADVVLFLMPRQGNALDVMVAKNRNGQAGQFRLSWRRATGDLTDESIAVPPKAPATPVLSSVPDLHDRIAP